MLNDLLNLPFTFSEKKEIEQHVHEICLRDGITESALFEQLELSSMNVSLPVIRQKIHDARFPLLAAKEKAFEEWKHALKLPPEISLHHAPAFEKDWLEVKIRFKNKGELQGIIEKLQTIQDSSPPSGGFREPG